MFYFILINFKYWWQLIGIVHSSSYATVFAQFINQPVPARGRISGSRSDYYITKWFAFDSITDQCQVQFKGFKFKEERSLMQFE